jgi:hypothetical protein
MLQQHQENPVRLFLKPHPLACPPQFRRPHVQFELAEAEDARASHRSGGHQFSSSSVAWTPQPRESSRDILAMYV